MRYVYVVTRIVEGETIGTPIPNLGVHKTFKKAKRLGWGAGYSIDGGSYEKSE